MLRQNPKDREKTSDFYKINPFHIKLIITSRTWHKVLANFYEESKRLTLCIGSYIEASVYGKTKMTIELLGQKFKIEKLMGKLIKIDLRLDQRNLILLIYHSSYR